MKRIAVFLLLVLGLAFHNVNAQNDTATIPYCVEGALRPGFAEDLWSLNGMLSGYFWTYKRWMFGLSFDIRFTSTTTTEAADFPFRDFDISTSRLGLGLALRFMLPSRCENQCLTLKTILSSNHVYMSAYDERCVLEDSEGDVMHRYKLLSIDGGGLGTMCVLSVELSYTIAINSALALELSAGCDITPSLNRKNLNRTTTFKSDWDEFETYYGTPTLNVAIQTAAGRVMNKSNHVFFGIALKMSNYDSCKKFE